MGLPERAAPFAPRRVSADRRDGVFGEHGEGTLYTRRLVAQLAVSWRGRQATHGEEVIVGGRGMSVTDLPACQM